MRNRTRKMEALLEWVRRDSEGKQRLRKAYKKATPKEQGISFIEED